MSSTGQRRARELSRRERKRALSGSPHASLAATPVTPQRHETSISGNGKAAGATLVAKPRLDLVTRVALALLVVAAVYRVVLILRGWPALDSDEAIIGLMARHILQGERPIFFWGQNYMGAFQAYFVAPIFAVFGSSIATLHLSVLLLVLGFLAAMYFVARAAYGPAVGVLTLGWLAIGPALSLVRELGTIGGYQEMLLFSALIVLGVWDRLRRPSPLPRDRREWLRCFATYAGVGLCMGVGLWSDLLIAPVLLMAVLALFAARRRELLSRAGLVLLFTFLLGAWPFLSFNIQHPNASYKQIAQQSHLPGQTTPFPPLDHWVTQIGATLSVGMPTVLGSPHVCVKQGDLWLSYPPQLAVTTREVGGLCDVANMAFSLGVLALCGVAAIPLVAALRAWWTRRQRQPADTHVRNGRSGSRATSEPDAETTARLWLRAMLLGTALLTILLYTTNRDADRYQFTSSRYLLPLYLSAPLLLGVLWQAAKPIIARLIRILVPRARVGTSSGSPFPARGEGGWGVRALATAALLALLLFSILGGGLTAAYSGDAGTFSQPLLPADRQLLTFLDAHHINRYYSDYWTCYRVAFEARENVICAVRGEVGRDNLKLLYNRNDSWVAQLAADPHPAYIFPAGSVYDLQFAQLAAAEKLPHDGYARTVVAGYGIHYYVGTSL
jgi:hypothetical protein